MALPSGSKLGPYEIVEPLGAGGMGEVYRARDTRLERTVAVKILPASISADPVAKQRLEREAKTISGLNHPNICVLHDVGSQDGVDYLVMECIEGESLAKRLERGALPLGQVLKYGAQIADALDKAHRSGVIHRDLKPGNIMLTATGVKLLDFGLAKIAPPLVSGATLSAAPANPTAPLTSEGSIVGTFQYMSPEQVEAKKLDARSDIFSFGAVLYEMLTGRRAFPGKSQLSVASAILEKEPISISALRPMTPPALERAVKQCVAKEPDDRWQSVRDLELELKWIAEAGPQAALAPAPGAKGIPLFGQRALILSLGALVFGAVIASLAVWNLKPSPPRSVSRMVITLPPGQQLAGLENGPAVVFSPDGTHLAYIAIQGGTQQLYLRALDSLDAKPLPGTEGANTPFFSPNGQWLGFFTGNQLKKVSVSGGGAVALGDSSTGAGASWGSQGIIAYSPGGVSALQQVPEVGGAAQPLARLEKGEITHRWPEFLPGGKTILFTTSPTLVNWSNARVALESVTAHERHDLNQAGTQPRYASSGHLVYARGGILMAAPFDLQGLALTGATLPVLEGVRQSPLTGAAQYTISTTGSLAYVPGGLQSAQCRLVWVDRSGHERPIAAPVRAYVNPRLSPDGRRVAANIIEQETQAWLYDLATETLNRFSFGGNFNGYALWTPDGKHITFQSSKEGPVNIFWQLADSTDGLERLTTSEYTNTPTSWSRDGQLLAFNEINPTTRYDIWVLRLTDRKAQPILQTPFNESAARFSPDGRWLAYTSDESGHYEIYVQPYPGPGGKWQVSTEGGTEPVWNPNGRELFYRTGDKMMAVDISTQPSFAAAKPRVLFAGPYMATPGTLPNYDVSLDGQRFLMLKRSEAGEAAPTQIVVVLNWFEELKRRVPPAKP